MSIKLKGSTDGSVSLSAPADTSPTGTDITLTLPTDAGSANQFIKNSGTAGTLDYSSMVEDSSGNVGIGTSSPSSILHLDAGTGDTRLNIEGGTNGDGILALAGKGTGISKISFWDQLAIGKTSGGIGDISSEYLRIDSSGQLLVGHTSAADSNNKIEISNTFGGRMGFLRNDTTTEAGNNLGMLSFFGNDSNGTYQESARISAEADLDHATDDKPGRLLFYTTADGASSVTERLRIDSSGFVGIGDTSPSSYDSGARNLVVGSSSDTGILIKAGTSSYSNLYFGDGTGSASYRGFVAYNHNGDSLRLGTSGIERMRLDSTGRQTVYSGDSYSFVVRSSNAAGTTNNFMGCTAGSTSISHGGSGLYFQIFTNGNVENTNDSYGQISDVKLKENIVDAPSQWDDFKAVRFRKYNFKEETGYETFTQLGVIAQELETVCPGLVYERPDRDDEGNDLGTTTKAVKSSILTKKALVALQEAMARIETLETKVAALEAA